MEIISISQTQATISHDTGYLDLKLASGKEVRACRPIETGWYIWDDGNWEGPFQCESNAQDIMETMLKMRQTKLEKIEVVKSNIERLHAEIRIAKTELASLMVAAGVDFLDDHLPNWRAVMVPTQLDMANSYECIIGQIFGNYKNGTEVLGLKTNEECELLGFYSPDPHFSLLLHDAWVETLTS